MDVNDTRVSVGATSLVLGSVLVGITPWRDSALAATFVTLAFAPVVFIGLTVFANWWRHADWN